MNVIHFLLGLSTVSPWLYTATGDVITFLGPSQPIAEHVGARHVQVTCQQNIPAGPEYTLVEVKHLNPIGQQEKLLGILDELTPREVASGYNLSAVIQGDSKTITLTIETVTVKDDGTFLCVATSRTDSNNEIKALKDFIVIHQIEALRLQFQDEAPITSKPKDPPEVEPGLYQMKCIAEGSNPPTEDVKLFVDGQEVKTRGKPEVALMDGGVRKYKSIAQGFVTFPENEVIHRLECLARDTSGKQLTTVLDIKVLTPDVQDIKCEVNDKRAKTSVSLTCTVDHGRTNLSSVAFEIGKTGEIIRPGSENSGSVVTTSRVSSTETNVTLILNDGAAWDLESDLYLLLNTTDSHVIKAFFHTLRKGSFYRNGGSCSMASVMCLTSLLTSSLWRNF